MDAGSARRLPNLPLTNNHCTPRFITDPKELSQAGLIDRQIMNCGAAPAYSAKSRPRTL